MPSSKTDKGAAIAQAVAIMQAAGITCRIHKMYGGMHTNFIIGLTGVNRNDILGGNSNDRNTGGIQDKDDATDTLAV